LSTSCSEEEKKAEEKEKEEHAALEPENVCCEIVAGGVGGECLENINRSPTATTDTTASTASTSTTCSRVEPEEDSNNEFSIDVCDDTGDEAGRNGADGAKIVLEAQVLSLLALLVQTYRY
jgi:hypothetical protein